MTPVTGGVTATPTIYDVARLAGVATSTVSRALSNPGRVSFKTAEHIRKIAEQIGYRSGTLQRALPDVRSLRRSSTRQSSEFYRQSTD